MEVTQQEEILNYTKLKAPDLDNNDSHCISISLNRNYLYQSENSNYKESNAVVSVFNLKTNKFISKINCKIIQSQNTNMQ